MMTFQGLTKLDLLWFFKLYKKSTVRMIFTYLYFSREISSPVINLALKSWTDLAFFHDSSSELADPFAVFSFVSSTSSFAGSLAFFPFAAFFGASVAVPLAFGTELLVAFSLTEPFLVFLTS